MTADPLTRLLALLRDLEFDRRYYTFYEANRAREGRPHAAPQEELAAVLGATGLPLRYSSRERFFSHKEPLGDGDLQLNIAFPASTVELGLYLRSGGGVIGGPFPRLARQVGQLRDPTFSPAPASPKLPYSNLDELREAVDFGVALFRDVRAALQKAP